MIQLNLFIISISIKKFKNKILKRLQNSKKHLPLQPQSREKAAIKNNGALVQLVRIHACHAWGHEFESRTHRNIESNV